MATWETAGKVRTDFADMVEPLSEEQLTQPTLCDQWDARGVLGHLTSFVELNIFQFFGKVAGSGFNFDKASLKMVATQTKRPTADVIAALRAKATKSSALPMFPEELTVSDTVIHTQDVRRPLGLPGTIDEGVLRTVLDFLTTHKMADTLVDRPEMDGVRLVATDLDWSFGEGEEISGSAEALMMGLARRPVLDELSGEGLARWS